VIGKKEFTEKVERILSRGGADVMGAILKVCEENKLEPEGAKRLLSNPLKEKLEAEAKSLKMIDRTKTSRASLQGFFVK
jgi:hypothetical protein